VHHSKLSADVAVALFGLAAPIETWTWHISDFASEVAACLPRERREWFFDMLLVEIDRNDQLSPSDKTIEQLHTLAQCSLPADSRARLRIAGLLARRGARSESRTGLPPQIATEIPAGLQVDITDPEAVDRHILGEELDETGRRSPIQRLRELAKQASSPARRLEFVRAVVEVTAATLSDKIYALNEYLDEWSKLSVALREALPTLGLRLGTRHAAELASSSVEAWGGWRGLEQHFHVDPSSLVEYVVAALRSSAHSLGGSAWLALAARLAPGADAGAIAEGLERFLANSTQKLPAEVGDGLWSVGFSVPADEAAFVASLVWARLGHPDAKMRWRAAHSVRRLTAAGRHDVTTKLIERFNSSASPFNDATLPFYVMHAQLWLLIALARVAKDESSNLVIHRSFFENIAFSTEFPHVVMRAFALDIVSVLATSLAPSEKEALIAKLALTNRSPYPHAPRTGFGEYCYMDRPDTSLRLENSFQLDYDFNKYQVERLCRVFGCPGWEVADRIDAWVRRWDKDVRGMHECPRSRGHEEGSSSEYVPGRDQYGSHLAWHALMLVAGDLLATRPVVGKDWDGDAWTGFLKEYTLSRPDGLWLADLTDPFPLDLYRDEGVPMPESGERSTAREDSKLLAPMLGLADGKVSAEWVPVAGRWSIGQDTTVSVRSVLANASDAQSLVMALLSEEPFFRWLPSDEEEVARDCGGDGHTVRPWVAKQPDTDLQLDRHDPYAAMDAVHRPFPSDWVQDLMRTSPDDPVVRHWSTNGKLAYRADAWGASGGRGEYAWSLAGHRLFVHSNEVLSLLRSSDRNLVVSIIFQKYHKGKSTGRPGDTSAFTHRCLVEVIDEHGQVWSPRGLSRRATNALKTLDTDRRSDFYTRFRAIAGLRDERLRQRSQRLTIDELYESLLEGTASDDIEDS
jgi:hypothetical protein